MSAWGELTVIKIILMLEFMALLISLAMTITPSKTGGDFSLADWFFEDPTYLQEVVTYLVLTNLLFGLLALVALAMFRLENQRRDTRR